MSSSVRRNFTCSTGAISAVVCLLCRLQEWAAKAAEREKAKAERRRERRERIKAGAERHRFDDPQYDQQKASIAENLEDALEEGSTHTHIHFPGFTALASGRKVGDCRSGIFTR